MAPSVHKDIHLEIAHVLFIDIVGYSKRSINEQRAAVDQLNQVVRSSNEFQKADAAERLIKIPTGDGMALVFYTSPEAPVQCAVEISGALKEHPRLQLRMGVHSGPISGVIDVTGRANLAGAGLNMAQRVMACGDAGHILLSKRVAEDLAEYEEWRPLLHDLGTCEVKHGVRIDIANLYDNETGNAQLPKKLQAVKRHRTHMRWVEVAIALFVLAAIVGGFVFLLRRPTRSAMAIVEKSIAVLPFENRSEDKANAYFADGIQDEILTRISKIADLKVISRTSTQHYKSAPENLPEIGKVLGVAHIVEGSVQKSGDSVRVNVQLIKAANDSHLWADTFDRKLTDIFSVESEVAKAIADQLRAKLTGQEEQAIAAKPTDNPEAYDAYLRGLAFEGRSYYHTSSNPEIAGFYERAVQLDPNFAIAWARLSRMDSFMDFDYGDPVRRDAAKRALENAQKLEPNSPETLLALGYYQGQVLHDWGLAKTTLERVSKMLPSNSEARMALGGVSRRQGNWDESIAYYEKALVLDPRNVELLMRAAATYAWSRQFPPALKLYDRALDIVPNALDIMAAKASIYQAQGNLREAASLLSQTNEQTTNGETVLIKVDQLRLERNYGEAVRLLQARLAQGYFDSTVDKAHDQVALALTQRLAGDMARAKVTAEAARNAFEQLCRDQPENSFPAADLSQAYAAMGQKDAALEAAERAIMLHARTKNRAAAPTYEENLALIQTIFGEKSRAISTLAELLHTPSQFHVLYNITPITPALLRLDPIWDPLRADPAFQKLCEEKQP